ncbi:MAG: hypothetical protein RL033_6418 [Pseudomonadota bacterium]|jgi:hypothetical protein
MKETTSASMLDSALLRQSDRTACRVIDGKAVVITIDQNQLHVLNAVGTRVWELADGRSFEQLVAGIVREFEVTPERARPDVRGFVEQLLAMGALQLHAAPAGGLAQAGQDGTQ